MPVLKHTHTYVRVKATEDNKFFLYRCADKDCTHREEKKFLLGKASRCTNCGTEMILTATDLRMAKPRCMNCKQTKQARQYREIKETVSSLFGENI